MYIINYDPDFWQKNIKTIFLILLITFPIFADGNEGNRTNIFPISSKQIQMLRESIRLTYGRDWFVEMSGRYKNFGHDTTVQVGIPEKIGSDGQIVSIKHLRFSVYLLESPLCSAIVHEL